MDWLQRRHIQEQLGTPGSSLAVSPLMPLGWARAPPGSSYRYKGPDLQQQGRSSGSAEASSDGMKAKAFLSPLCSFRTPTSSPGSLLSCRFLLPFVPSTNQSRQAMSFSSPVSIWLALWPPWSPPCILCPTCSLDVFIPDMSSYLICLHTWAGPSTTIVTLTVLETGGQGSRGQQAWCPTRAMSRPAGAHLLCPLRAGLWSPPLLIKAQIPSQPWLNLSPHLQIPSHGVWGLQIWTWGRWSSCPRNLLSKLKPPRDNRPSPSLILTFQLGSVPRSSFQDSPRPPVHKASPAPLTLPWCHSPPAFREPHLGTSTKTHGSNTCLWKAKLTK